MIINVLSSLSLSCHARPHISVGCYEIMIFRGDITVHEYARYWPFLGFYFSCWRCMRRAAVSRRPRHAARCGVCSARYRRGEGSFPDSRAGFPHHFDLALRCVPAARPSPSLFLTRPAANRALICGQLARVLRGVTCLSRRDAPCHVVAHPVTL